MPPPLIARSHISTRRLAAAALATMTAAVSLTVPGEVIPSVGPVVEFWAHAGVFAVVTAAWGWARPHRLGMVVAVAIGLALGTEWLQATVVPIRTGSVGDALANLVGVGLGAAIAVGARWAGRPGAGRQG